MNKRNLCPTLSCQLLIGVLCKFQQVRIQISSTATTHTITPAFQYERESHNSGGERQRKSENTGVQ